MFRRVSLNHFLFLPFHVDLTKCITRRQILSRSKVLLKCHCGIMQDLGKSKGNGKAVVSSPTIIESYGGLKLDMNFCFLIFLISGNEFYSRISNSYHKE